MLRILTATLMLAASITGAASSSADPLPPECERVPIFGLNPYVREICDTPIQPDGSWIRFRSQSYIGGQRSSCGGNYYPGGQCPPWLQNDVTPAYQSPVDEYIVTWDTIPPGEPGHLG